MPTSESAGLGLEGIGEWAYGGNVPYEILEHGVLVEGVEEGALVEHGVDEVGVVAEGVGEGGVEDLQDCPNALFQCRDVLLQFHHSSPPPPPEQRREGKGRATW